MLDCQEVLEAYSVCPEEEMSLGRQPAVWVTFTFFALVITGTRVWVEVWSRLA